ncbi:MAG: hypothetical protein JWO38_1640 [Gemmataceae bacterium]|nr:hypothetical protein [Gemmataceae bacterium]
MSSGYDDGYDGPNREAGPGDDGSVVARARAKVATPGLLLILVGLFGVVLEIGGLGLIATNPTIIYDFFVEMVKNGPPGPEQQKQLDDLKQKEAQMRLDAPLNIGSAVLGLVLTLVTVVGGVKMRSLSGYGVAIAGAVAAIIPIGGCCCVSIPIGIWALVVLMNEDVKAGFAAAARTARAPRDEY